MAKKKKKKLGRVVGGEFVPTKSFKAAVRRHKKGLNKDIKLFKAAKSKKKKSEIHKRMKRRIKTFDKKYF